MSKIENWGKMKIDKWVKKIGKNWKSENNWKSGEKLKIEGKWIMEKIGIEIREKLKIRKN